NVNWSTPIIWNYLIEHVLEQEWIKNQGMVYGTLIQNARVMDGLCSFLSICLENDWSLYVISHKTRDSVDGVGYDLHTPVLKWLEKNRFYGIGIDGSVKWIFSNQLGKERYSESTILDVGL
ncbi:MAG TPA: hypothetical protein VN372_08525, partial [Methanospirillum sp.]|nr:hypothetical protein [Methanospirillum sp.]